MWHCSKKSEERTQQTDNPTGFKQSSRLVTYLEEKVEENGKAIIQAIN